MELIAPKVLRVARSGDKIRFSRTIYWVAMTTPYVLLGASKADWIAFLKRTMVQCDGTNDPTRLHNLLKRGLETHYWNEFVFKAYVNYQADAVFLTGIPDMKATLPHA